MTPRDRATQCLRLFEAALGSHDAALQHDVDLAKLGAEVTRKERQLRAEFEALSGLFDVAEFTRRYNAFPEEIEIRAIHERKANSWAAVQTARASLQAALDALRAVKNQHLFSALAALSERDNERYVQLATLVLGVDRVKRRPARDSDLMGIRTSVRQARVEAPDDPYAAFCKRLDARRVPLPPSARWRKFGTWEKAHAGAGNAVTRWLSENSRAKD